MKAKHFLASVCIFMTTISVVCVIVLARENAHLKIMVSDMNRTWIKAESDKFRLLWTPNASYSEKQFLLAICGEISRVCREGRCSSFQKYNDRMKNQNDNLMHLTSSELEEMLEPSFRTEFLFAKNIRDFSDVMEFEAFARINIGLAMMYGNTLIRKRSMEILPSVEELTFRRLKQYRDKFLQAGQEDLLEVAEKFIVKWIQQIESPDGFTRQSARYLYLLNTEYAKVLLNVGRWKDHPPGKALTHEEGLRCARSAAAGLIRCGYRPKWLEEFRGSDPTPDPWEVNFNPAKEVEFVAPSSKSGVR